MELLINELKEGSTFVDVLTETRVSTSAEVVSASTTFKDKKKRINFSIVDQWNC